MTDSMDLYASRLQEMTQEQGPYTRERAVAHHARYLLGAAPDHVRELSYHDRKALHQFKYFTWVEQQGRTSEELNRLWDEDFWRETFAQEQVDEWDRRIAQFNAATGALNNLQ